MKLLSIKSVAAVFVMTLLISACTDLTDGYSTDPVNITDPTVISTDKFLSGTEVSLIGIYEGDMNRLTGMWVGYFSGEDRQYIGLANYGVSGRDFNTEWGGVYSSVIKNAHIVKSRARDEKNTRMLAIAQAIEAMSAGLAADLWGDVPFSEMGQYPTITTPKYDAQSSVYANVQVLLDSAIANFKVAVPKKLKTDATNADFFFEADSAAWIAACNTLKARYYLHTRDYVNAQTYSNIGIQDASGNMMAPHGSSYLQNFNLFYSFTNYDRPGYMGGNGYAPYLLDSTMALHRTNDKTKEDARLNYYYLPGAGYYVSGDYEPNFLSAADDWIDDAAYDGFFGTVTSFPLVTYEENILILAESLAKQNNFDDALTALNSYRSYLNSGGYWSPGYNSDDYAHLYAAYDNSDFASGGMENADGIADIDALLREILEERYITLLGQLEGFNDIRRTNNLLGIPVKSGNSTIPLRLLYPQSEINTNPNVPTTGVGLFDPTATNQTPY